MNISTDDLLPVAHKVLTGEMTRDEMAELSFAHMAFIGITMMLTRWERYGSSQGYIVHGSLSGFLEELASVGTSRDMRAFLDDEDRAYVHGYQLRDTAKKLGLYKKGDRHRIALSPPAELLSLVEAHRANLAVQQFFSEAAAGPSRRNEWRQKRRAQRESKSLEVEAREIVTRFEERYGGAGLQALQAQLDERTWQ